MLHGMCVDTARAHVVTIASLTSHPIRPCTAELSDISKDNIIEGERSTRAKDFSGDDKLDDAVEKVAQADREFFFVRRAG